MSVELLAYFDSTLHLVLWTHASPFAVGVALSNIFHQGTERPIQFASHTSTVILHKYANIDIKPIELIMV